MPLNIFYVHYGHRCLGMGRRKFRLKCKKNSERKRQATLQRPKGRPQRRRKHLAIPHPTPLPSLSASLKLPSKSWSDQSFDDCIRLCKINDQASTSMQPLIVTRCLLVKSNGTWEASVNGCNLNPLQCQPLHGLPLTLNPASYSTSWRS